MYSITITNYSLHIMSRIAIDVMKYGDFDMPYSECIMLVPEGLDYSTAKSIVRDIAVIVGDDAIKFVNHAKAEGFETMKVIDVHLTEDV